MSEWFSKKQYAGMIGHSFTLELMGTVYGRFIKIENYNWQSIALTLETASMVIDFMAYLVLRSPQNAEVRQAIKISSLKSILTFRLIWCLAFSNFLMVGSLEEFTDIWNISYLMTSYNSSKSDAAGIISFVFFGMLFGGALLAWFSKKLGAYTVIATCVLGMILAFILLLMSKTHNAFTLSCLFFLIGIICCYQVIIFAVSSKLVEENNLGSSIFE